MSAGTAAVAFVAVPGRCRAALAAGVIVGRKSLDNAVASKHAAVDGKVAADHECAHRGVFLGQQIRLICQVGLVLASID